MKDDPNLGCGYWITWRGWMKKACEAHDPAYVEGSDAQKWLSRKDVDDAFLRDLLLASRKGRFQIGKKILSYISYGVVRAVASVLWEGKK